MGNQGTNSSTSRATRKLTLDVSEDERRDRYAMMKARVRPGFRRSENDREEEAIGMEYQYHLTEMLNNSYSYSRGNAWFLVFWSWFTFFFWVAAR